MFENNVRVRSGKNYSRSVLKHFVPLSCKMYWPTECRCTRPTKCWSYKITAYKIDYPDSVKGELNIFLSISMCKPYKCSVMDQIHQLGNQKDLDINLY